MYPSLQARQFSVGLLASLLVLSLILLSACSKPAEVKQSVRYSKTEAMLAMEADPFVQTDRQEMVFGEDLLAMSVLPVLVKVQNNGDKPVPIEARRIKLILPSQLAIPSHSAVELTKWLASQGNILGQVGMGAGQLGLGQLGQFAGPYGGIAVAIMSGLYGMYKNNAAKTRDATYNQGEFKDVTLAKNQSVQGIVFFILPKNTPAFNEATLSLSIFENQAEISHIDLPLKGLGYKGTPDK